MDAPRLRKKFRTTLLSIVVATGFSLNTYADGLPDLGEISQAEVSPHAERKAGEAIMQEIRALEPNYLDDPEVASYLNRLGGRLGANVENSRQAFEFFALRETNLNAFALPGGYIGVHTGLILAAQSESELAGVLSHEISHVTQHHIARMMVSSSQGQIVSMIAMALAILAARGNSDATIGAIATGQAASIQNQLNFSRDFEREADRIGLDLLEKSGMDIRAMGTFFERLQKFGRVYDNNAPSYLRTHPLTTERIADMANRIEVRPHKTVEDSLDFSLVRAKLRAELGTPVEAISDFKQLLTTELKGGALVGAHYGMARAQLRARAYADAKRELSWLRQAPQNQMTSPMLDTLVADVMTASGDAAGAIKVLTDAHGRFPQENAITYALIDALLVIKNHDKALSVTAEALLSFPNDAGLHERQAKTFAQMGRRVQQHRAQADAYVLLHQLPLAIEQLTLAQKEGDGDYYENSRVDARIRQLKIQSCEEAKLLNSGSSSFRQRRPVPAFCRFFDRENDTKP
ncbi:MAG: M48 family metallopeptidase [Rhodocyclaceae bacterium]|nr:M48 family metallopeptidase [Rhodocyclaceae bacterium]MBP6279228.1 M48 family metallopeptidase [Rhodocyclaceae bacterium]